MAPVKAKGAATRKARKSTAGPSKSASKIVKRPPPKQVKTKPASAQSKAKPKKPQYTDSQLSLPALNSIMPASATAAQRSGKGTGKKKNKVYIDDQEGMMTILALVNAKKEGVIESKMIKERQLEEIREARRKEAEKRAGVKKDKFAEVKKELKQKGSKKNREAMTPNGADGPLPTGKSPTVADGKKKRKSVSFA